MADVILTDKQLSNSAYSHIINAPLEKIDIAGWLFNLAEAEYQRCCPPDHISCGTTSTDSGTKMSINVEMIGPDPHGPALYRRSRDSHPLPHGLNLRCLHVQWPNPRAGHLDPQRQEDRRQVLRVHQQRRRSSHAGVHGLHRQNTTSPSSRPPLAASTTAETTTAAKLLSLPQVSSVKL